MNIRKTESQTASSIETMLSRSKKHMRPPVYPESSEASKRDGERLANMTSPLAPSYRLSSPPSIKPLPLNSEQHSARGNAASIPPLEASNSELGTETNQLLARLNVLLHHAQQGDKKAERVYNALLDRHPELKVIGDLSALIQTARLQRTLAGSALASINQRNIIELKQTLLAEGNGTRLEELLVDIIVRSKLQMDQYELTDLVSHEGGPVMQKISTDRVAKATDRILKTIKSLKLVRAFDEVTKPKSKRKDPDLL